MAALQISQLNVHLTASKVPFIAVQLFSFEPKPVIRLSLKFSTTVNVCPDAAQVRNRINVFTYLHCGIFFLSCQRALHRSGGYRDAKMLRGAIWRVAEAALANDTPHAADIRTINRGASQCVLVRHLDLKGTSMRWHQPTIHAALSTIAQDAVILFGDPRQRARLRRCEHERCRVIFFDDSRPGMRRWCASNRCGDRTRARTYRERKKT